MQLSDFDFPFEPSLVADRPVEPRDQARLMVLDRTSGDYQHRRVSDLPALLAPGDLLVVNDTRVLPARLNAHKRPSGGRVELLFVKDLGEGIWEVMIKGKVKPGQVLDLGGDCEGVVVEHGESRTSLHVTGPRSVHELMEAVGVMPLPPYIKRQPTEADRRWYQSLFAKREGAIAAPTAGLHMTERLLDALHRRGVAVASLTLHVGRGTFLPVRAERVEDHVMEAEKFELPHATAEAIRQAKAKGRRVVAVGTTVIRSLESAADADTVVMAMEGETDLFVVPGYRFRVVDAVLTNFHLPRTTLVMLVSAFAGLERLREAYGVAIRERYRFYSYGDAMLIL